MSFAIAPSRLEAMLQEDSPYGDLTTAALRLAEVPGRAVLRAGAPMTVCCPEEAESLFRLAGATEVRRFCTTGAQLEQGSPILQAEGMLGALHRAAPVAQSLLGATSGVATRAASIRAAAQEVRAEVSVACSRRHLPGTRDAMLKAVMAAGCVPHRLGLSDAVLVLAQHRALLGREPPYLWVARLRAAEPARRIAVEVASVDEAVQLAHADVDIVQLAGLKPEQVAEVSKALGRHPRRPLLAAAGGVTEANAAAYARAGADVLVTSAPWAASPLPVSALLERAGRRLAEAG
ncbi:ModD protein [Roseomonas sp. OT10]|uniref:ModD protein n=1 Tax=Roseomonas cutis TaxID=2897332 RepID=UPI001E37208D|nr:ModD protein [Roseomonas sp. OT10]UFN49809.1 ModD protein [Roseomonas sp. OT10]